MAEELKQTVDAETTEQLATDEKKEVVDDLGKDLEEDIKKFEETRKRNFDFATKRLAEKEGSEDDEDKIASAVQKAIEKVLPTITASTQEASLEALISQKTNDPKLKEAIKFHLTNSVSPSVGSLTDRIEMAQAIATRKLIIKKAEELKVASLNRSQMSNSSQGSHSEGQPVKDSVLSPNQVAELRRRGWNDKKIDDLKKNLSKQQGR